MWIWIKIYIINYPCRKISNNDRIYEKPADVGKYRSLVGSLLYVAVKNIERI